MFGKNAGNFQLLCSSVSTMGRLKTREWKTRDGRKVTLENPKPTRITEFNVEQKHMTHTSGVPVPVSLKLSIRHFAGNVVMLYSLK